ncbi:MAG TPA: patatin-like phospholipase family protein [Candidatus Binatia bacterium]|nr:patatin-like phospholipase family protein [Candidatus Binatia bacterium]
MPESSLTLRAGPRALERIRREGFTPAMVGHIGAAAGGPKWMILDRLDRALFGTWFRDHTQPVIAVGASIGGWRLACAAQRDPVAAIQRFEDAYLAQAYAADAGPADVSREAWRILAAVLGERGAGEVLAHPWLRLNVVAARTKGWIGSSTPSLEALGYAGALLANAVSRRRLAGHVERVLLHVPDGALRAQPDGFVTHHAPLTTDNLPFALMASASIPGVMPPVRDIPGAPPGPYIDGGMIDYHMDLPLPPADDGRIAFLPHFSERVVTGWLDKFLPWRRAQNLDGTLVLAPSPALLARLPGGRIPDRRDFSRYKGRDAERIAAWKGAIGEGQRMADEFLELARTERFAAAVRPLVP